MGSSLVGRVTLVTNCCNLMGEAISRRLGMAGSQLLLWDPDPERLTNYSKQLSDIGVNVHAVESVADLSKRDQRNMLFDEAKKRFGRLDYMVANMGQNNVSGNVMEMNVTQFDEVMERYLTVPFRLAQDAVPLLQESGHGCILLLSSMAAFTPFLDCGMYAIAQSAVVAMCKALAVSAAPHGVRVNCVATGIIAGNGSGALWDKPSGQEVEKLCTMIPAGRIGQPLDCAGIVSFLLSDRAKYITGENTLVAGGICVRF